MSKLSNDAPTGVAVYDRPKTGFRLSPGVVIAMLAVVGAVGASCYHFLH